MDRLSKLYTKFSHAHPNSQMLIPSVVSSKKKNLIEIKHRIGKQSQKFELENWYSSSDVCVGRWVANKSNIGQFSTPLGSFSWGVWSTKCNIGSYRIHDQYGNMLAYRFDILKDVKISKENEKDCLEFLDLIVDIWIWPTDGKLEVTFEDIEELAQFKEAGKLLASDLDIIERNIEWMRQSPEFTVKQTDYYINKATGVLSSCESNTYTSLK